MLKHGPAATFVIRMRADPEGPASGYRWSGQVQHVQSGSEAAFADLDGLVRIVRKYLIAAAQQNGGDREACS